YEYKCNYESFIFSTISNFLGQGKKIYLFSFCKNEGDEDVINYYLNKFSDKNIEGVNYSGNIDIFLDKFSRMETIVGTRFHSIVLALVFKQKLMAISYSDKTNNMLESVGYKGHILDIQNLGEISNIDSFINYDTSLNNNIFSDAIKQFTK
ncbi:polysaccharide pyruvyl transferase family protein, partial [Vibrio anguillarum]